METQSILFEVLTLASPQEAIDRFAELGEIIGQELASAGGQSSTRYFGVVDKATLDASDLASLTTDESVLRGVTREFAAGQTGYIWIIHPAVMGAGTLLQPALGNAEIAGWVNTQQVFGQTTYNLWRSDVRAAPILADFSITVK